MLSEKYPSEPATPEQQSSGGSSPSPEAKDQPHFDYNSNVFSLATMPKNSGLAKVLKQWKRRTADARVVNRMPRPKRTFRAAFSNFGNRKLNVADESHSDIGFEKARNRKRSQSLVNVQNGDAFHALPGHRASIATDTSRDVTVGLPLSAASGASGGHFFSPATNAECFRQRTNDSGVGQSLFNSALLDKSLNSTLPWVECTSGRKIVAFSGSQPAAVERSAAVVSVDETARPSSIPVSKQNGFGNHQLNAVLAKQLGAHHTFTVTSAEKKDGCCSQEVSQSATGDVEAAAYDARRHSSSVSSAISSPKLGRLVNKSGDCNVSQINVPLQRWKYIQDIFTTLVDVRWRWSLLIFCAAFVLSWTLFAGIYFAIAIHHGDYALSYANASASADLHQPCIANVHSFLTAFMFSVETQTTIGFGQRHTTDECSFAIIFVCIQSILGIMIQTFMTGFVFAKLARPEKRAETLMFSKNAVICMRDGRLCFLFRVGDMRRSHIVEAHVRLQMIKKRKTNEGEMLPFHQFDMNVGFEFGLDRIFLVWPVTICHVIDEDSPLYEYTFHGLRSASFEIIAILEGVVESRGMTAQARTSFLPTEILWGHSFVFRNNVVCYDTITFTLNRELLIAYRELPNFHTQFSRWLAYWGICSRHSQYCASRFQKLVTYQKHNGEYRIDFDRFHDTYPWATPTCSARDLEEKMRLSGLHVDKPFALFDGNSVSHHSRFTPLSAYEQSDYAHPTTMVHAAAMPEQRSSIIFECAENEVEEDEQSVGNEANNCDYQPDQEPLLFTAERTSSGRRKQFNGDESAVIDLHGRESAEEEIAPIVKRRRTPSAVSVSNAQTGLKGSAAMKQRHASQLSVMSAKVLRETDIM